MTVEDLVRSGNKLDATAALLDGEWQGFYQELNPSFDTVFFNSVEQKLEFMLSGSVSDSSLVKEVAVRDSFRTRSVVVDLRQMDRQSWTGIAKITFADGDSVRSMPVSLDLGTYLSDGLREITFGASDETDPMHVFDRWQQTSFQEALSSPSFNLVVEKLSVDSLRFSLPNGYGQMLLVRKR